MSAAHASTTGMHTRTYTSMFGQAVRVCEVEYERAHLVRINRCIDLSGCGARLPPSSQASYLQHSAMQVDRLDLNQSPNKPPS